MTKDQADLGSPSRLEWVARGRILHRFESLWRAGEMPDLAAFLPEEPWRQAVLLDLVYLDLKYRHQSGLSVRAENYAERFPELAADRQGMLGLLAREYELRRWSEPGLTVQEYRERFPEHGEDFSALLRGRGKPRSTPSAAHRRTPLLNSA
jgi:hypothetical protein